MIRNYQQLFTSYIYALFWFKSSQIFNFDCSQHLLLKCTAVRNTDPRRTYSMKTPPVLRYFGSLCSTLIFLISSFYDTQTMLQRHLSLWTRQYNEEILLIIYHAEILLQDSVVFFLARNVFLGEILFQFIYRLVLGLMYLLIYLIHQHLRDMGAIRMVRVFTKSQPCLFSDRVTYTISG